MSEKIKSNFLGWDVVAENLERIRNESKKDKWLNEGIPINSILNDLQKRYSDIYNIIYPKHKL